MILFSLLTYQGGTNEEKKEALEEGRLGLAARQYFGEKYQNYTIQQLQDIIGDEGYSPDAVRAAKEVLMCRNENR